MSTANEWDVELNRRREISSTQGTMYYFVYRINTIALSWQEKSTLLMNENKRIASPWIKIVKSVGAKALDEKCVETIQNQIMGVIFNIQNSQAVIWFLPTEKSFRYMAKIGLWQIFQLSIFVLSHEKCHFQSDWIRNFWFLFPYFGFFPFRKVWTSLSVSGTDFSVF